MLHDRTWAVLALCAQDDPDRLFVRGAAQRAARTLCFECPVRRQCLAEAMDTGMEFGVWGGLTERERRALRQRHPEVRDWDRWLRQGGDGVVTALLDGRRRRAPSAATSR